jgi:hypothetical protein
MRFRHSRASLRFHAMSKQKLSMNVAGEMGILDCPRDSSVQSGSGEGRN